MSNRDIGLWGEETALKFLKRQGYRILKRNFRHALGEIDIIAQQKDTICFVEVKTRRSGAYGTPAESVHWAKQRKLSVMALFFLKQKHHLNRKARFDVVSVIPSADGNGHCRLIQNAFELTGENF